MVYNAEDFDIVMSMYNLLEYSGNYSMTSGSLWNYYKFEDCYRDRDQPPQPTNEGDADWPARPPVPSMEFSILNLPLINFEVELDLLCTTGWVLIEHYNAIAGVDFKITSSKHYVSVVTLSINDNMKFLEHLEQGFKRTISWKKYRSEITT